MTIEIKKNNQETIIEIVGRLDTITAPALDKTINEILPEMSNIIFTPDNAGGRNRLELFPGIAKLSGEIFIKSLDNGYK